MKVFLRQKAHGILECLGNREIQHATAQIQSNDVDMKSEYKSNLHAVVQIQCLVSQLICRNQVQEVRCNLYRGCKDCEKYKILNEFC